jgi:hypothetical protein
VGFTSGGAAIVSTDLVLIGFAVVGVVGTTHGVWRMLSGWRAKCRGGDPERLMMAGLAQVLGASGIWYLIGGFGQ